MASEKYITPTNQSGFPNFKRLQTDRYVNRFRDVFSCATEIEIAEKILVTAVEVRIR